MLKDLWSRIKTWIKDIPWQVPLVAMVVMALVGIFLVSGKLNLGDWVVLEVFAVVIGVFIWKMVKRIK